MKKIFLLSFLFAFGATTHAQKKLTPVTKSPLTGIGLPNGSKQDSRILSVAAAATLLEMESDKTNTKLQNTEVLNLPPASLNKFNKDSLIKRLAANQWKIIGAEGNGYMWAQKDKRIVIAYLSMSTNQTDLYLAEATSAPAATEKSNTTNQSSTQAIVQPATQTANQASTQNINQPTQNKTSNTTINSPIVGTWRRGTSVTSYGGRWNSTGYQYTFNANGTYTYVIKTYVEDDPETLLTRESGIFTINGNNVTLDPKTNVIEAWSKSNGGDNYKALVTRQNKSLEKITYQFTIHYFPELKENDLVLVFGNETVRDGKYNAGNAFPTGWRFSPDGPDYKPIPLPGEQQTSQEVKKEPAQQSIPAITGKFAFTSTNFDDGWVSTVQEDWVQVTKGNIKVLIHYPNKNADTYNSVLMDGLKNAWNVLVAPKYSSATNFEFKPIQSWQSVEFAEADAVEKATGKSVHVVLFKMNYSNGSGRYVEFITPDKKIFEQEFGAYHDTSYGWENVEKMANYNKFAVAPADLTGKWTNNFSGTLQYVNAYTGANAGMDTHSSNQNFEFGPQNTYKWDLSVASGMIGNIKFQNVKSSGQFSLPNNWQINFSDLEGKPKTYNAYFSCAKGVRILWLEDAAYPSGYTGYGKVE